MAGVNKVIELGRLGKDPEVRNFQNGGKVVNLRLATSERYKDREGNQQERTEWHAVAIFNQKLGEIAEKYLKKGSKVYLEGRMETRKWQDQSGVDKYTTEVVIPAFRGELTMLSGRGEEGGMGGGGGYQPRERAPTSERSGGGSPSWEPSKGGDLDDEIPF